MFKREVSSYFVFTRGWHSDVVARFRLYQCGLGGFGYLGSSTSMSLIPIAGPRRCRESGGLIAMY